MTTVQVDQQELIDLKAELLALKQLASTSAASRIPAPRTTSSTLSELVGFNDFLPHERTSIELENAALQIISKDERIALSSSDRSRVFSTHVKGLLQKFKAISTIAGLDKITTIDNLVSFSQQRLSLQKHIASISANDVFYILKFDSHGDVIDPDTPAGAPINLLTTTVLPSLVDVEKSTFFYNKRGTSFNQENLSWTYESIRNSCDKALQEIIDAKMLKYTSSQYFGPLYYYHLINQMTNVDSKAVRAITQELSSLKTY